MAINTLRTTLPRWVDWKRSAIQLFAESAYPLLEGVPKFSGSLIQRFNIRNGRAARPYRDNIAEIKKMLSTEFFKSIQTSEMVFTQDQYGADFIAGHYCLAEIPDFQGLLPKAHQSGVPVFELTDQEIGETGNILAGMQEKRVLFREQFREVSAKLVSLLVHA